MNERSLAVLEQYDLQVYHTRRGRGSYICETDQGLKLLCECTGSEKRLVFLNQVLQQVRDGGYEQVDMVIANREGSLVSRDKDEIPYVLKDWFPGRECDTASETDIRRSVQNLARLHRVLLWSAEEELPYPRQGLALDYEKKTRELKKVRTFIRRRDPKNNFELKFLGCFSEFFAEAEETRNALARLEDAEEGEQETRLLCHGDYDHHHVLLTDSGTATIGFEKCRGGYPITDLYQFMRKILEKQNWSLRMGMIMLEEYDRIRRVSREERTMLKLLLAYPDKFWKLANYYYNSRKAWIPDKHLEKLENLISQQKKRKEFLNFLE